ncbi:MAG TPA: SpoIIIAH-like family protein [Bacilli bacterium]|nr:SpoIIIAH-like family protein [Bacilli bacterium]
MANKQSLWFLVLFSLILVLSVYYITMPNELFLTNNTYDDENDVVEIKESEIITAMKVELDTQREELITTIKEELNNASLAIEEKNNAYEKLLYLNQLQGVEETIETKIKKEFSLDSFVKVEDNNVTVVVVKDEHDATLANDIMASIQKEFDDKMHIKVTFKK